MVGCHLNRIPRATEGRGVTEIQVTHFLDRHAVIKGGRENVYSF